MSDNKKMVPVSWDLVDEMQEVRPPEQSIDVALQQAVEAGLRQQLAVLRVRKAVQETRRALAEVTIKLNNRSADE